MGPQGTQGPQGIQGNDGPTVREKIRTLLLHANRDNNRDLKVFKGALDQQYVKKLFQITIY